MTFSQFIAQEARWAAQNNPLLKKLIEDNLRYVAKDRPMTNWNTPNADIINNQIWNEYLRGLTGDTKTTAAPETPVSSGQPKKKESDLPDYLTEKGYWGVDALIGEGGELLSQEEHTLDFYGDEPFTEVSLKHEEYRTYIYGDGVEFTIKEPVWLITDHSAPEKHIVEDATAVYEVRPGWLAIKKGY